ncbi:MAG TPA: hypothetical protein VF721_06420 [Pyrinomonadaceae bacterium]|jgi:hypothetical protein
MSKNKSTRREFLEITGVTLTGIALANFSVTPNVFSQQPVTPIQTSATTDIEEWLLNTGADDIPQGLYQKVLPQLK